MEDIQLSEIQQTQVHSKRHNVEERLPGAGRREGIGSYCFNRCLKVLLRMMKNSYSGDSCVTIVNVFNATDSYNYEWFKV